MSEEMNVNSNTNPETEEASELLSEEEVVAEPKSEFVTGLTTSETETESVVDETTNTISNGNVVDDPKSYKVIRDMLKEMKEWGEMYRTQVLSVLSAEYNLSENALYGIGIKTDEEIENSTLEDYQKFYNDYRIKADDVDGEVDENQTPSSWPTNDEEAVKYLKEIKELQLNLYNSKKEYEKLSAESDDIMRDYINYMSSDAVTSVRRKNLERLKESIKNENVDEKQRKEMEKMIHIMENAETLNFLFNRVEEFGEKEIDAIVYAFFDPEKGKYIIEKFKNKIKMFGFNPQLYKYFFNLEETFLPSEYHVFDNLFLFIYMRYVAYANPNDKTKVLWVQALTSSISNLVYHKYPSTTNETQFMVVMKKYLDNFKKYHDYFEENNSTHPNHPVRREAEEKYEKKRCESLIKKMDELHIEGYDPTWNSSKLYDYLNSEMEKLDMVKSQDDEKKNQKTTTSIDDDGVLNIEPMVESDIEDHDESDNITKPENG